MRGEAARLAVGASADATTATAEVARAYSVWARLEREYALSDGRAAAEAGGLLLPRHSRETFMEFMEWMTSDAERARSMEQVRLAVRSFLPQTRLTDWSTDSEVASLLEQLEGKLLMESSDE